jgi:hypothetical protein
VLHLPPYRCAFCRRRFSDADAKHADAVVQRQSQVFASFLRPEDDMGFKELIEGIAQAERDHRKPKVDAGPLTTPDHDRGTDAARPVWRTK